MSLNSNVKIYKHLDEKVINDTNIKLYTWNHEKESIKLIDDIINHYYYSQNWNKFIKENSNTIDIGAHSGDTLIPLILGGTNFFKSKTKILALDPNPYVRECCELNAMNNISENVQIIVLPFAITDKDNDKVILYDHGNDMCNGGIIHDGFSENLKQSLLNVPNKKGVECTGMTLETICNTYFTKEEIDNISFIKIDTEGYDREIIYSSKDFLNKHKPVIFMEWFDFYNENESIKLFEIIKYINYIPFNPVTLEIANVNNKIWDLLLIHKNDIENLKKTKMQIYYSQCAEDEYLNENIFKNKLNGTYIELGALDGQLYSNTKFFEDILNWTGILIEPHPEKFKLLQKNRPNNFLFNNLISSHEEPLLYRYFVDGFAAVSGVENSLSQHHFDTYFNNANVISENNQALIYIEPKSLSEIIKSTNLKHIDLLSLDVEGHELEVLESWDFSIPINVILIETLGVQHEKDELCRKILTNNGYKFFSKIVHNEIYIKPMNV